MWPYMLQQKCLSGQISLGTLPDRNPLVQLLALYTDPRAIMLSVTDRQTDDMMTSIADHTV